MPCNTRTTGRCWGTRCATLPHDGHERATHAWVCAEVARLLGVRNVHAESNERVQKDGREQPSTLHIPDETLTIAQARTLGIQDTRDVLGGVVPYPFWPPRSSAIR